MKKLLLMLTVVVTFFISSAVSASALTNDMIRVGMRHGSGALFSANLENARGEGFAELPRRRFATSSTVRKNNRYR